MIQIVTKAIAVPLKERGYRKKALTWNRSESGIIHVVDLQQSRFSRPGTLDITLNFGVMMEAVWRTLWEKDIPKFVKAEECFPRFRPGELLADKSTASIDRWWAASESIQAAEIARDLESIVRTGILPFLESLRTESEVKRFVDRNPSKVSQPADKLALAVLAHRCGGKSQCEELLRSFEDDDRLRSWSKRVEAVRRSLQEVT